MPLQGKIRQVEVEIPQLLGVSVTELIVVVVPTSRLWQDTLDRVVIVDL